MFLRLACVLATVCVFALGAQARPLQSSIVIDQDIRVFTMVAALNVAGFDVELASQYHPVRAEIRKIAEGLDPDLLQKMKEFYTTHRPSGVDDDQLAKYISLAVVLTDPPAFKPIAREEGLPDDARSVLDFVPLLQEFYQKGGVARLWARVGPSLRRGDGSTGAIDSKRDRPHGLLSPSRVRRGIAPEHEDRR